MPNSDRVPYLTVTVHSTCYDQPVGRVELLRNPSLVAISAAAIRDRLSEQSSKDGGVADRIAGDGFRKGSTHPTHFLNSIASKFIPETNNVPPAEQAA